MDTKILFVTRLVLYFLAIILPALHPAIAVGYDLYTKVSLFFLLPFGIITGYYYTLPQKSFKKGLFVFLSSNLILSLAIFPFGLGVLFPISIGLWGFLSTVFIFRGQGRFSLLATLEVFLLAFIYYKILEYSRSSEEIAKLSKTITNLYIILTLLTFLVHSIVLYIISFSSKKLEEFKKELVVFSMVAIPIFFIFSFILPPDFITHKIELNPLEPEPPKDLPEGDGFFKEPNRGGQQEPNTKNGKPLGKRKEKYPSELQNEKNNHNKEGESSSPKDLEEMPDGPQSQKRNRLEGVPSEQWEDFKNSQSGKQGKQLAVMIIASEIQPIYAAESYLTEYNPQKGFEIDANELLNELKSKHLISSWKDPNPPEDEKRSPYSIFYLTTIKDRVLAYRPFFVEPTIMDKKYHPFDLSYTAVSAISMSIPEDWKEIYIKNETTLFKKYLQVPLEESHRIQLNNYLNKILQNKNRNNYFQVLDGILSSYKIFQYKLGFNEATNIDTLINFLYKTKEGDCTEFSAVTVLLLRMAGIPSRLVYGWIASRELQTPAHLGGLKHLRKKIPYLQKFDLKNLYLVTNAHRHAWVQVYIPKYGWIDIETTSYAIPPKPEFDPNAQDVVIPLIEEEPYLEKAKEFVFPYKLFFGFLGILLGITLLGLYLYKIFLNLYLFLFTRRYSKNSLNLLNRLFYMRLFEYGYPKRKFYETPFDYVEKVPETHLFAQTYTELKFRTQIPEEYKKSKFQELKEIYKKTLKKLKPKKIIKKIFFIFNLKGIFFKI
ncbi:MAG: transglutaminase-like domain-containing protein [Leptonema sp. (in: bacteria)]